MGVTVSNWPVVGVVSRDDGGNEDDFVTRIPCDRQIPFREHRDFTRANFDVILRQVFDTQVRDVWAVLEHKDGSGTFRLRAFSSKGLEGEAPSDRY